MNSFLPIVATSFFDPDFPGSQAAAIDRLLKKLRIFDKLDRSASKVLIKPDLSLEGQVLGNHLTTLAELISSLSGFENKVMVGDSPPNNDLKIAQLWQKTGLDEMARKYDFDLVNFEKEKCRQVALYQTVYYLPEIALTSDFLINLTYVQPNDSGRYTGVINNLAGVLPGKHHIASFNGAGETERINLLVDLLSLLKPALNLVVVPACYIDFKNCSGGEPGQSLMMGSTDAVAIDALLGASSNGIKAENALVASACEAGLGIGWPEAIILKDPAPKLVKNSADKKLIYRRARIRLLNALGKHLIGEKNYFPYFDQSLCDSCGICVDICPSNALNCSKDPSGLNTVEIKHAVCLLCHICREGCPQNAIGLELERTKLKPTPPSAESATN